MTEIVYRVDENDLVVFVNAEWDRFAIENRGAAILARRVLRRSLWDFICDEQTRNVYAEVLRRARAGETLAFPFRCDSPECERALAMTVTGIGDGQVVFRTALVSETPREAPAVLDPEAPRSNELLRICSWCKRAAVGEGWLAFDAAIATLCLFERRPLPRVAHGICPDCLARWLPASVNA
jgi:hypothetical protein